MRTKRGADALFPEIRKLVLATLLMHPERRWFASDLARGIGAPKTSLQRELKNLYRAGIIHRWVEGKHVYYQADSTCPFFPELRGLMTKTAGLVDVLVDALKPFAKAISVAFIYGSIPAGQEDSESDVDVMVVGKVGLSDLAIPLRRASQTLGRDVHATTLSTKEFASKAAQKGEFIPVVLGRPKLFIVGDEHDLERAVGSETGGARSRDQTGDREPKRTRRSSSRRRHDRRAPV